MNESKKVFSFKYFITTLFVLTITTKVALATNLVDNGNGTITDTGLMWIQDINYAMSSGVVRDSSLLFKEPRLAEV
jgi:hypothetical protein